MSSPTTTAPPCPWATPGRHLPVRRAVSASPSPRMGRERRQGIAMPKAHGGVARRHHAIILLVAVPGISYLRRELWDSRPAGSLGPAIVELHIAVSLPRVVTVGTYFAGILHHHHRSTWCGTPPGPHAVVQPAVPLFVLSFFPSRPDWIRDKLESPSHLPATSRTPACWSRSHYMNLGA